MVSTRRGFLATAFGGVLAAVGLARESGTRVPLGHACPQAMGHAGAMGEPGHGYAHDFEPWENPADRPGPTGDGDVLVCTGGQVRWVTQDMADAILARNADVARANRLLAWHYDGIAGRRLT